MFSSLLQCQVKVLFLLNQSVKEGKKKSCLRNHPSIDGQSQTLLILNTITILCNKLIIFAFKLIILISNPCQIKFCRRLSQFTTQIQNNWDTVSERHVAVEFLKLISISCCEHYKQNSVHIHCITVWNSHKEMSVLIDTTRGN